MAQNYLCDICGAVAADYMITNVQTGQTLAVGVECILDFAMPLAESYGDSLAREQAGDAGPAPLDDPEAVKWEEGYPQTGGDFPDMAAVEGGTGEAVDADTSEATHADR